MKRPLDPGTAIDAKRYKRWISRFGSYRAGIINVSIESWLEQFDDQDQDLAARVLDAVEFYGQSQIHAAYRQALAALDGWHKSSSKRRGQWRFAAMSGSAGESGDAMLYQFRIANGMDAVGFNDLFVSRSDLFRQPMLPDGDPQVRMMRWFFLMISAEPEHRSAKPGTTRRPLSAPFSQGWERSI